MKLFHWVEHLLDGITMYRVVLYGLLALVGTSFVFSIAGLIPFSIEVLALSLASVLLVSVITHKILAKITKAPANLDSTLITALILFFLIFPESTLYSYAMFALAGFFGVVTKYVLAWNKQHIANPAAVAAAILFISGLTEVTWWIGSTAMFIPTAIFGALVVIKIRKYDLVGTFLAVGLLFFILDGLRYGLEIPSMFAEFWLSWPTVFLAAFMLTEPFTTPPTRKLRVLYAVVVAFFVYTSLLSGFISITTEIALVIGNLVLYPTTLRRRLLLPLTEKLQLAPNLWEFRFKKPKDLDFQPGQYLEWTVSHETSDKRGIRRYFTIASAPEETDIRLGIRVSEPETSGSSFKQALLHMKQGDIVSASQISGDFLLPRETDIKLVFIAGGIGITPFRSHVASLLARDDKRDVTLFYCNRTNSDIVYQDVWDQAIERFHMKQINMLDSVDASIIEKPGVSYETGYITIGTLDTYVSDVENTIFYISGAPGMVNAYKKLLREYGVKSRQIVTDFFPGLT